MQWRLEAMEGIARCVALCLLVACVGAYPAEWGLGVARGSILATDVPQNFLQYDPQNLPIVANGYLGTLLASSRFQPCTIA